MDSDGATLIADYDEQSIKHSVLGVFFVGYFLKESEPSSGWG
mgnify:FL=1